MRGLVISLAISGLALTGCAGFRDSGANPANWFGASTAEARPVPATSGGSNPLIPEGSESIFRRKSDADSYAGTPIYVVESVVVEPAAGGAIVTATGLSRRQGAFDVRLSPENGGMPMDGILVYTMRTVQRDDTPPGAEQTRRVTAGQFVPKKLLEQVRGVRVQGLTTTATSTR